MLLVDLGNSRVKWASWRDGRLGEQRAATYAGWSVEDWQRTLFAEPGIERVVAARVGGGPDAAALDAAARRATAHPVEFVATTAEAGGVRNAYPDPGLLGVDRWLAVIAAYARVGGACCVADVGTAATVDGVDADGRHLGGFIVPGPDLMMRALWRGTADLATHTATSADNTRDAIERGCRLAVAALVDRSVREIARRTGTEPRVLLTGGAAPAVAHLLETAADDVPDLVLRGLAMVAGEGSAG